MKLTSGEDEKWCMCALHKNEVEKNSKGEQEWEMKTADVKSNMTKESTSRFAEVTIREGELNKNGW